MLDAAFLDPPYNVLINGHANTKGRHREFAMASGEMSDEAYSQFLADALGTCARVSRDGAVHYVCMDWRHMDDVSAVGKVVYGDLLNLCIWNKSNAGMGSLYRSKHELIFVYKVGQGRHFNAVELGKHGRNRTNVWDYASVNSMSGSRRQDLDLHPTVKPTALVADAIQDVTKRGDLILDIFLGSGTTLIAAERTGRRFRGLDIDPAYVDVAIERWATMTGRETQTHGRHGRMSQKKPRNGSPVGTRFKKGRSGNPKGRPKQKKSTSANATSAFDIVMDKTLTITNGGVVREVTVEEALQHQTYQQAVAGSRMAQRQILKMIEKREKSLAARRPASKSRFAIHFETDPDNAEEAMAILGAVYRDTRYDDDEEMRAQNRWHLEPWVVKAALGRRRGGDDLSEEDREIYENIASYADDHVMEMSRWRRALENPSEVLVMQTHPVRHGSKKAKAAIRAVGPEVVKGNRHTTSCLAKRSQSQRTGLSAK